MDGGVANWEGVCGSEKAEPVNITGKSKREKTRATPPLIPVVTHPFGMREQPFCYFHIHDSLPDVLDEALPDAST
jgi:hypothetical protein